MPTSAEGTPTSAVGQCSTGPGNPMPTPARSPTSRPDSAIRARPLITRAGRELGERRPHRPTGRPTLRWVFDRRCCRDELPRRGTGQRIVRLVASTTPTARSAVSSPTGSVPVSAGGTARCARSPTAPSSTTRMEDLPGGAAGPVRHLPPQRPARRDRAATGRRRRWWSPKPTPGAAVAPGGRGARRVRGVDRSARRGDRAGEDTLRHELGDPMMRMSSHPRQPTRSWKRPLDEALQFAAKSS